MPYWRKFTLNNKTHVNVIIFTITLNYSVWSLYSHITIEGFGGKRALGFLLKSELCQKRSKFCMQFCLRVSNNVLHVFSLKFALFDQ